MAPVYNKKNQIELQNIIFNTAEKKLMVSNEFLEEMTKHYISKRMKAINQSMEGLAATKVPKNFFTYYNTIIEALDELIAIEPYHTFKSPEPSAYRKNIESRKSRYVEAMLNRAWKDANQKAKYEPRLEMPRKPEDFEDALNTLLEYREHYSESNFDLLNQFYTSVYGYGIGEEPEPEPEEEAAEGAEEAIEGAEGAETDNEAAAETAPAAQ